MWFNFLSNRRQRLADTYAQVQAERRSEREHQAVLLKTFLTSLETIQETSAKESSSNSAALIEVARSISEQAKGFGEWMKCFQVGTAPTTTFVREDDEYRDEQLRNAENGLPADIAALPEEFKLAWALRNDPNLPEMQ